MKKFSFLGILSYVNFFPLYVSHVFEQMPLNIDWKGVILISYIVALIFLSLN